MKTKIYTLTLLLVSLLLGGCGIISILGTPAGSEEFVEAKYDISQRYGDKILVLVKRPGWLNMPVNYQKELTNKINSYMRVYLEDMPVSDIIDYDTVKDKRASDVNFNNRSVVELGEMFGAGTILYVEILEFNMLRLSAEGYYSVELRTMAVLYDAAGGKVLWPDTKGESVVSLEIECEKGVEATMVRLATANAHCILRNFYDCKRQKYKVIEEKKQYQLEDW